MKKIVGLSADYQANLESDSPKQFPPKPGDKIICNNAEEFVCCTLEFLRETISQGIRSDKSIFGYSEKHNEWQDWNEDALSCQNEYGIKEVIPIPQEVKQEATEVVSAQEKTYTVEDVFSAIDMVTPSFPPYDFIDLVKEYLGRDTDPEYQLYLELKDKFEGKE